MPYTPRAFSQEVNRAAFLTIHNLLYQSLWLTVVQVEYISTEDRLGRPPQSMCFDAPASYSNIIAAAVQSYPYPIHPTDQGRRPGSNILPGSHHARSRVVEYYPGRNSVPAFSYSYSQQQLNLKGEMESVNSRGRNGVGRKWWLKCVDDGESFSG